MLKARDKLGDYEIVAKLKAGGMAQVYLARRRGAAGFTRPVALKLIHSHLAEETDFVRMFVDEATLSAKIEAPNVVHVEELGQIDGTWFQAMEYVHGASLAQVVRALRAAGRRCTPELAAHIVAEIAAGLHAAHETTDAAGAPLGIVHRDVSPQNVLVSYRGNVKVCDFGIAKAMHRAQRTKSEAIRGKIAYMSPEQALGHDVDRRTDVYALGIVLYELLVLERPFDSASEIGLLEKARHPDIERPSRRVSGIPSTLDDVVMKALALRPEDRPQTAGELRRLVLDAAPGAREVESSDVAALLRAVMSEQIEEQAKLLPLVSEGTMHLEMQPPRPDEPRADEALKHLTVAAVVVPLAAPSSASASASPSFAQSRDERRPSSRSAPVLIAIGCAAALVAALAFKLGSRGSVPASDVAPAMAAPAPTPVPMPAPLPATDEPATATATATAAQPVVPTAAPSAAVDPNAASSAIAPAPAHPRRPPARPAARPAPSSAKPTCRKVGGVELCE
jgi:serine/threonine-protein kinase